MFSKVQCIESCRSYNFEFAVANPTELSCNCMKEVDPGVDIVHPFTCADTHPFEVNL